MEHTSNPFPGNTKGSTPSKLTKIIAIVLFVLVVAALVFYLKTSKISTDESINLSNSTTTEENIDNGQKADINIEPASVDLGMVETDLTQISKNLDTVDNLENL